MATHVVSGDQYREVDRRMNEIKRQLNQPGGSPLDPDVVARRLQLIIEGPTAAPDGSTTSAQAAAIMGSACHGVDALERHFGVTLFANEAAQLAAVPFSREVLMRSCQTHVLVACARASIMGLRAKAPDAFYFKKAWYLDEEFAHRQARARWRLIRKEPVPGSTSKTWAKQQAVLSPDELTPGVCEMVLAIILHYLETGERLLSTVYVRTGDVDAAGRRVGVGRFGPDGLRIRSWGDYPDYYIGLAGVRASSWNRGSSASAILKGAEQDQDDRRAPRLTGRATRPSAGALPVGRDLAQPGGR
jgi:hypothetical protein